jgi:hypothetical protein
LYEKGGFIRICDFNESLLSLDRSWPQWIQDSFEDVRMKLRFIRLMITLESKGTVETQLLKMSIADRFFDMWGWKDGTDQSQEALALATDKLIIRRLSGALWGKFVDLLQHVDDSWALSDEILDTIRSIHHLVKQRPAAGSTTVPIRLNRFVDTAVDVFVFIGLLLCEWQRDGVAAELRELELLLSLSSATRDGLAYLMGDQIVQDHALLEAFDDVCWNRFLGLESTESDAGPLPFISAWLRICRGQTNK